MRYRSVAIQQPKSRSANPVYLPFTRNNRYYMIHHQEGHQHRQNGGSIISGASDLYMKNKETVPNSVGEGLRLAGQRYGSGILTGDGLGLPGRGISLPGRGLSLAGGGHDYEHHGEGTSLPGGALKKELLKKLGTSKVKQSMGKDLGDSYAVGTSRVSIGNGILTGMGKKSKKSKKSHKKSHKKSYKKSHKKSHKMKGRGESDQKKGLSEIRGLLADKVIPKLVQKMNLQDVIPKTLIDNIVDSATSKGSATMSDVLKDISLKLVPVVTQSHITKEGGASGGAYFKKVKKTKEYKKLNKHMRGYLKAKVKGQSGKGFFQDLWSGIKKVFRGVVQPIVKIAAPIASVLMPEFAVPINVAAGVIGKL